MEFGFPTILWVVIAVVEVFLVTARFVLEPSPLRLSLALSIPLLLILGAAINAIFNLLTTGSIFDSPPPRRRATRH